MTDLEKADILREKAGVSYAEAKEALENSNGSVLDALVYLEKQGKVDSPVGGGFYSGAGAGGNEQHSSDSRRNRDQAADSFADVMRRFSAFCHNIFNKSCTNYLVGTKDGKQLYAIPVLAFVILLILFFWVTLPAFVISLFCGVRYRFSGADLGRESVNSVMDSASDVVDYVKKSFVEEVNGANGAKSEAKKDNDGDDDDDDDSRPKQI
ncbi:MAG: hypothetical protein FWB97_10635 [Oscillospiraceae bacterium]|nr:hypothetical protein [Oscillospiraceae bacterium]